MEKFYGSLEELQAKVQACSIKGEWKEIPHGHQFRSKHGALLNWFSGTGTLQFQGNKDATAKLKAAFEGNPQQVDVRDETRNDAKALPAEKAKVFVVHGHGTTAREQLELVLHRLGLEPFVLANTGGGGMTMIEALEQEIVKPHVRARFGIVLLTLDDMGYAQRDGEVARQPHSRQNVVLETGMLLAALG